MRGVQSISFMNKKAPDMIYHYLTALIEAFPRYLAASISIRPGGVSSKSSSILGLDVSGSSRNFCYLQIQRCGGEEKVSALLRFFGWPTKSADVWTSRWQYSCLIRTHPQSTLRTSLYAIIGST